mmetsp:Transcript_15831/g.36490  ORF Transcript_15831/g.36490 Transcript_15831/m.36490 type:complete len:557 (-) Transcript_15831:102-1772(-)
MSSNNDEQQNDDDSSLNRSRIRRDPKRGRGAMPEPDNVVSSVAASTPTFRAMAIQNRQPQLIMPSVPVTSKPAPFGTPLNIDEQLQLKSTEQEYEPIQQQQKQQQPERKQQQQQQQFVLNTKSLPCFGWNISNIIVQNIPMYFPRDLIQWEFPYQDLPDVLERIAKQFRGSSIQAALSHEPLSAKLQTCTGNAELYLVFFNDRNGIVSMSLQRHKGDHVGANRCIRRLVDAAKGILSEDDSGQSKSTNTEPTVSPSAVLAMERLIERCAAEIDSQDDACENNQQHIFLNQTPEQMTQSAIRDIHSMFDQPRRLDLRRDALEYLLAMTDLKRTLRTTAISTSLIVLQGRIPDLVSSELNSEVKMIQSTLLKILLTRELPGDRDALVEDCTKDKRNRGAIDDMDLEIHPYFPEVDEDVTSAATDLPQYYSEFMNELFNLTLRILVQSLEVVACFPQSLSGTGNNFSKELFAAASQVGDGKDLYQTLLSCVWHAESKIANGYLACKALRLLALDHPGIRDQIKYDDNAKQSIGNAYQVGQMRHTLLKEESYQLWQTVCQ